MKYTEEEMIAMAKSCQWYSTNNPALYSQFLLVMSVYTGTNPAVVHKQINDLANK